MGWSRTPAPPISEPSHPDYLRRTQADRACLPDCGFDFQPPARRPSVIFTIQTRRQGVEFQYQSISARQAIRYSYRSMELDFAVRRQARLPWADYLFLLPASLRWE